MFKKKKFLVMINISYKKNGLFIHIHKSGGSYIETILRLFYDFEELSIGKDNIRKTDTKLLDFLIPHPDYTIIENTFKFVVVRNPYIRAISSYKYMTQNVPHYLSKDLKNLSFSDFLLKIINDSDYYKTMNQYIYTHCIMPQYMSINDDTNKIKIDYIAKYENIIMELDIILQKLNITDRTLHHKIIENNIHINKSKSIKNNNQLLFTQELLDALNNNFKDDFIKYDYKMIHNIDEIDKHIEEINKISKENEKMALIKLGIIKKDIELDKSLFLYDILD